MDEAEPKAAPSARVEVRRSTKLWLLAFVLLGLFLLFIMTATKEQGPSHSGRPAEEWLREVGQTIIAASNRTVLQSQIKDSFQRKKASVEAFQQMGPPGVQFLVEALGRQNSRWNRIALDLHPSLPDFVRRYVPEPVNRVVLPGAASTVLVNLKDTEPVATFGRLVALLESPSPNTRLNASVLIWRYTEKYESLDLPHYAPQFRSALDDANYWIRVNAVLTMHRGKMADAGMIPALSPALTSGDSTLSNFVQIVIRKLEKLPAKDR